MIDKNTQEYTQDLRVWLKFLRQQKHRSQKNGKYDGIKMTHICMRKHTLPTINQEKEFIQRLQKWGKAMRGLGKTIEKC